MHSPVDILNLVADILVLVTVTGMAAFVVSYSGFYHWRKTRAGRSVFYVFLALLLVAAVASLTLWIGPQFWFREWLRFFVWSFASYSAWNIVVVLWSNYDKGEVPLNVEPKRTKE